MASMTEFCWASPIKTQNIYQILENITEDDLINCFEISTPPISQVPTPTVYDTPNGYLKEFLMIFDQDGLNQMLIYIKSDMHIIYSLVNKNIELFVPFCRNEDPRHILKCVDNIIDDITNIQLKHFKICRFNNDCKYKECCAYIHEIDFQLIYKTFKLVQQSSNKLLDKKAHHYASGLFRNLSQLEIHLWHLLSRKNFGKKIITSQ
jgi:hypothetical protein